MKFVVGTWVGLGYTRDGVVALSDLENVTGVGIKGYWNTRDNRGS